MKKITFILGLIGVAFQTLSAQSAGNSVYNRSDAAGNSIYSDPNFQTNRAIPYNQPKGVNLNPILTAGMNTPIKADVMINVVATSYVAVLSVTQVGESISETDSLMDIRLNNVFDALKQAGIPLENTHVDFISMIPKYEFELTEKRYSKTQNEVPAGFEMKKNVHVRFTNHDRLNDLISAAAKAEIYDLVKIDYNVADMDLIYQQLRKKAEEVIDTKVASYTRMGFKLDVQNYATTQGSVYPMERYMRYTAANTGMPKFYGKKSTKEKPVEYNYAEKNSTIYYEKVPYNQFDLVLNADLAEPTVQFYFNMTVNYKIVIAEQAKKEAELAKRDAEDRELELLLKRAEINQRIKAAGGNPATVHNNIVVKGK